MQVNDTSRMVLADIKALGDRLGPEDAAVIAAMIQLWERDTAGLLGLAGSLDRLNNSLSVFRAALEQEKKHSESLIKRLREAEALNAENGHDKLAVIREIHAALGEALEGNIRSLYEHVCE